MCLNLFKALSCLRNRNHLISNLDYKIASHCNIKNLDAFIWRQWNIIYCDFLINTIKIQSKHYILWYLLGFKDIRYFYLKKTDNLMKKETIKKGSQLGHHSNLYIISLKHPD